MYEINFPTDEASWATGYLNKKSISPKDGEKRGNIDRMTT